MKCRGKFKFKEITKTDAGSFTNSKGDVVNYSASYKLKLDEKTDKGIQERIFKIPDNPEHSDFIKQLNDYEEYSDIIIDFDVVMYTNSIRIVPTAIITK